MSRAGQSDAHFLNGGVSFWYSDIGGPPAKRAALDGNCDVDICIVGGGFTGLWAAYYLKQQASKLSVAIIEKEFAGFGASGRNGGNLTGLFTWSRQNYLKHCSAERLLAMEIAVRNSVNEVIDTAKAESIDADVVHAGNLAVATTAAQLGRIRDRHKDFIERRGYRPEEVQLLSREEILDRVRIEGALGGIFNSNSARVQPAKLARGLAAVVEAMGVSIYEGTTVLEMDRGRVRTTHGTVRAGIVVRATEGFTPHLPGYSREIAAINSAIIVTEPLSDEMWQKIGWAGHETVSENSYAYNYCQRTREGRITIGGRGVPYRFRSRTDVMGQADGATVDVLRRDFMRLFPQAKDVRFEQVWCGVLGWPRDWCPTVGFDRSGGYAWAGGYAGSGVAISNLAGRTLRDLILDQGTELTALPWVGHKSPNWEPEPLRWLGIHAGYHLYGLADYMEKMNGRKTSKISYIANRLTGRNI
ncbi:FAD-dependent oxidoreductase [Mesorhizobium sp. 8]|nr:FAD-dependent oxidoreductase [Mesorhizobium sp. 8]